MDKTQRIHNITSTTDHTYNKEESN